MPPATPELFNTVLAQSIPRAADMGIEVVELRPGYVKSKTPFDGNGNHIGTMYAGVLFTAAELLGGAIALSTFDMTKFYPVVKGLSINFRRPATGRGVRRGLDLRRARRRAGARRQPPTARPNSSSRRR